jgi:thiol:disulfide interchange protein
VKLRTFLGNCALLLLLATAVGAVIADQKDRAAIRPASESRVSQYRIEYAQKKAQALHKILMVEFGADWCEDCVVFERHLSDGPAHDYFQKHFMLLKVDIGQSDRNLDVAESLGLDLNHGIPAVIFYGPDGRQIGATNNGELEPSRNYSAKQILQFLKQVAENGTINKPMLP